MNITRKRIEPCTSNIPDRRSSIIRPKSMNSSPRNAGRGSKRKKQRKIIAAKKRSEASAGIFPGAVLRRQFLATGNWQPARRAFTSELWKIPGPLFRGRWKLLPVTFAAVLPRAAKSGASSARPG